MVASTPRLTRRFRRFQVEARLRAGGAVEWAVAEADGEVVGTYQCYPTVHKPRKLVGA